MNFFMSALVLIGASLLSSCSGFSATLVAEKTKLTTTWEPDAELKIRKLLDDRRSRPNDGHAESSSPFMVALCGIPGSGKSTSAGILGDSLNDAGYPSLVFPHVSYTRCD